MVCGSGLRILVCIGATLMSAGGYAQVGSYDWNGGAAIHPGIKFAQESVTTPRVMDVFCLRIDSQNKWVRFATTGRADAYVENSTETLRKTTRNFMRESRADGREMVVAINGDGFQPWPVPWNQETLTDLTGLAVSDGVLVSPATVEPSFVVFDDGSMDIVSSLPNLTGVVTAVSGFSFVLSGGTTIAGGSDLHPRTGIGISQDGRYAYFLVIDGRRTGFSEGATTEEVGAWLLYFGAYEGLNMDGGGSSTMARYDQTAGGDGIVLLNHPVGNGITCAGDCAASERANGNNTGVFMAPDTDADLLPDDVETNTGTFIGETDTGTNPFNPDTDGDGVRDGIEVELGTDPNNPLDTPSLPVGTVANFGLVLAFGATTLIIHRARRTSKLGQARR